MKNVSNTFRSPASNSLSNYDPGKVRLTPSMGNLYWEIGIRNPRLPGTIFESLISLIVSDVGLAVVATLILIVVAGRGVLARNFQPGTDLA